VPAAISCLAGLDDLHELGVIWAICVLLPANAAPSQCHAERHMAQVDLLPGPHDRRVAPSIWPSTQVPFDEPRSRT
jgi:hypothetical protein